MSKYCSACGKENGEAAAFCAACGNALAAEPSAPIFCSKCGSKNLPRATLSKRAPRTRGDRMQRPAFPPDRCFLTGRNPGGATRSQFAGGSR